MIKISDKTNLLEKTAEARVVCADAAPNYHRDIYPYTEVPKITFGGDAVATDMPEEIWITDTTFRDGQQAVEPYTEKQIVKIFSLMAKLSGEQGKILQTEFFVYGKKNISAVEKCRSLGYKFPEITTWIRANRDDLKMVKALGIKETGILTSVSDYQIYKKLGLTRKEAMQKYLAVVTEALSEGIIPRCHLEDLTRADFYGFVLPLIEELCKLSERYKIPVKLRLCDTLGMGVPYVGADIPRSVPRLITEIRKNTGVTPDRLEWHGHNDFYKGVVNASSAWLYGCSVVNCSIFGRGERTGNIPLEAMVFEYASLKGDLGGMRPTVITELAEYYKNEIGFIPPANTPFVGENFNVTRAGIHADGLMKDEEIYNIFDTKHLLDRPPQVQIGPNSGAAGIAYWLNTMYHLKGEYALTKNHPLVSALKLWVDEQFESDRQTLLTEHELENEVYKLTNGRLGKCD